MPTLIQVVASQGQTVYVFIWNALGQIWNGSAFVTYVEANWATYAITATEQAGSGSYFATIPVGITAAGTYSWAAYIQLAGSPAALDTPVDKGPFIIPAAASSFIVPSSLSGLITIIRTLANDLQTSKLIRSEQLGGAEYPEFPVDGVNTTFQLKSLPMSDAIGSPMYTWITIVGTGAVVRTQTGFTIVDPLNGIIQFSVAPNPGSATAAAGVYAAYNYLWFTDDRYAQFLYQAAQATIAGTTDPTTIPNGLSDAMMQYAMAEFWKARGSSWIDKYAATGGDTSEQAQTPAQTFLTYAKDAKKNGDMLKVDYYQRQGQREAPGWVNPQSFPPPRFDKITPRH